MRRSRRSGRGRKKKEDEVMATQAKIAEWSAGMGRMREETPEIVKAFGSMYGALTKEGALTAREKELIALGIGIALRCEGCVWSHVSKSLKMGVTREAIVEAAGVAVMMGGGPVYTTVPKVLEAIEHFSGEGAAR